jgi:CubicO group peptidase (beta-lactamase class C family)
VEEPAARCSAATSGRSPSHYYFVPKAYRATPARSCRASKVAACLVGMNPPVQRLMRVVATVVALLVAGSSFIANAQSACGTPSVGKDGWRVAQPETVGINSATLCSMDKWLQESKETNVHALLVVRHGQLVFEQYFSGSDMHLGQAVGEVKFGADVKHDERSITKSITALILGIAIDRGWIRSINEAVMSFFPQYADLRSQERDRITIADLLTMSSGLEWHEFGVPYTSKSNSEIAMDTSVDPYRFALEQKIVAQPGQVWNYSSGSAELVGAVLRKATGKPLDQLAREVLFQPLGIENVEWYKYAQGNVSAAAGLRLCPRDLAKIGQLMLQQGTWNGKQIVPVSWILSATSPHMQAIELYFYGYQFWLGRSLFEQREVIWASAIGNGGERMFIVPELDLVVVMNAGLYDSPLQASLPVQIFNGYVMRAIQTQPQSSR